jgi:NAD(P)-dependent dehydrogenase (short-subunit alcohol dehydrogenase family)
MIDFTDQVAIVTGAGRGLGRLMQSSWRAAAPLWSSPISAEPRTARVGCHGRRPGCREIELAGGTAVPSHDSVDSPEGGEAIARTALDRFGRLDAVVSDAGIFDSIPFEELSPDDWRRMLSVHLDGVSI